MAAVVRVKRRRDADPAESLLISCKRRRLNDPNSVSDVSEDEAVSGVFKFAATVSDKEAERISLHIRDAIRKEKLEKENKHHQMNVNLPARIRREQRVTAEHNRYRVTAEHNRYRVTAQRRALNLEDLDLNQQENAALLNNQKQNGPQPVGKAVAEQVQQQPQNNSKKRNRDDEQEEKKDSKANSDFKFCLYDLEADTEERKKAKQMKVVPEGITCNGVVMERVPAASTSDVDGDEQGEDYVYDLYYLNKRDFDFRMLENILAIEAYSNDFVLDYRGCEEEDYYDDDDDDSNDEGNWRNDYPEEDPHFYENQDTEYFVGDDGHGFKEAFEEESDGIWELSEKFQQGFFSKNDDDADDQEHPFYDAYKKRVLKDFEDKEDEEEDT